MQASNFKFLYLKCISFIKISLDIFSSNFQLSEHWLCSMEFFIISASIDRSITNIVFWRKPKRKKQRQILKKSLIKDVANIELQIPDTPRYTPAFFYINSNLRLLRDTARCIDIPRLMKTCIITDSRDRLSILPFNEIQKEMAEEYWIPHLSLYVNSIFFFFIFLSIRDDADVATWISDLLSIGIRVSTNTVSRAV